jgi:hypothetical protein
MHLVVCVDDALCMRTAKRGVLDVWHFELVQTSTASEYRDVAA